MSFSYEPPDVASFYYTLLEFSRVAKGDEDVHRLLYGGQCYFDVGTTYIGNDYLATALFVKVPMGNATLISEEIKGRIKDYAEAIMPRDLGLGITWVDVSPLLQSPPSDVAPINSGASTGTTGLIKHDGILFRSRTEIIIYDKLKLQNVLFFANATAILGGRNQKKEPDFLICENGRWGILEVMGDAYHTPTNAPRDHERARYFKNYGVLTIEFYDAVDCYNKPDWVIQNFLGLLRK